MKIYIDAEFKCHTVDTDGTFREIDHEFFDGKCAAFVEGYCYDDRKGYAQIYPWKPVEQLLAAQAQYELDMAEAERAYQEGVNSV